MMLVKKIIHPFKLFQAWFTNSRTCCASHSDAITEHESKWELSPLTPEYVESEHRFYFEEINRALKNSNILNIALSGNYGVGKSSILKRVSDVHRDDVIELSMSTLAPISQSELDDSIPSQATTPTNRIQREIVKQLLYRAEPRKTPGSRFRRIDVFNLKDQLTIAIVTGIVVSITFMLTGWTEGIISKLPFAAGWGAWGHLIVGGISALVWLVMSYVLHGQISIRQISAGSAVIQLDRKSVSYFDQYLDEIVYFFQRSEHSIVIFEDIDRFDDSLIFEALRSLNTLLNAAPQIDKPIRFIYATKDSIFDLKKQKKTGDPFLDSLDDVARAEAFRANRTKFFDLIIPVVPFITHQSARDLTLKQLRRLEGHGVEKKLFDLASKHVPDMRLLKNIVNEFVVFKDRIFSSGPGRDLDLSESGLFAMMLFKGTHISDFEKIPLGKSCLDELYDTHRQIVGSNIRRLDKRTLEIRRQLSQMDSLARRSEQLGKSLKRHVDLIREICARGGTNFGSSHKFFHKNTVISDSDLMSVEFWKGLASEPPKQPVIHFASHAQRRDGFTFTKSELETIIGSSIDPDEWDDSEKQRLNSETAKHQADKRFLRTADMGDLLKRPEFKTDFREANEQSLNDVARKVIKSELARDLIREGYITQNFTLYCSRFHNARVSADAKNFLIHNIHADIMDEHFQLSSEDVEAIILESGPAALAFSSAYNINIVDHLLQSQISENADILFKSLASLGDDQTRFIQAYFYGGSEKRAFIEKLTEFSSDALCYLIEDLICDEHDRIDIVNTALSNLNADISYKTSETLGKFLADYYSKFEVLLSEELDQHKIEAIVNIFASLNIHVPDLCPLSRRAIKELSERSLFSINAANLAAAIGGGNLSLDNIYDLSPKVYNYVLANMDKYLSEIDGSVEVIIEPSAFVSTLEDTLYRSPEHVDDVVKRSSQDCIVKELTEVSDAVWPSLAESQRFPLTYDNVKTYISAMDGFDVNLANFMEDTTQITEVPQDDEEGKKSLATEILRGATIIPSAATRVKLIKSLSLSETIDLETLPEEDGEIFGTLVANKLIEDDEEVYRHLAERSWSTREYFIINSSGFKEYMTPDLLTDDLGNILESARVNQETKRKIIKDIDSYIQIADPGALNQIARVALEEQEALSIEVIKTMVSQGLRGQAAIDLLWPHLGALNKSNLLNFLSSLDHPFGELASAGRTHLHFRDTPSNQALIERLKQLDHVTKFSTKEGEITVKGRRKVD